MTIRTFLGPLLLGTQKNINPAVVTSASPSPAFLVNGPAGAQSLAGGYRNTGTSDAIQALTIPQSTLTAIPAASFPYTFYPTYTVQGVNYPIVIPAGSYIDNIDLNITTAVAFSGAPTGFVMSVNLIGAPGSTYAAAQTIATAGTAASTAILSNIGNFALANSGTTSAAVNPLVATSSATPLAMLINTGPTDCMLQLSFAFTGGTTPAISAGAFTFLFSYVVRNPDGTWYPQTPPSTVSNPPVQTY
jgi:hypothetical protein